MNPEQIEQSMNPQTDSSQKSMNPQTDSSQKCFCDNEIITRPSFIHGNICLDCLQDLFVVCICDFNKKKFNHFTYECLEDSESPEGPENPENPEPESSGISKHHVYINDLEELVQYKLANKVQDVYIVNTCRGCQTVDESVLEYYKEPIPELEQQKEPEQPEPEITLSDEDLNILPEQEQEQEQEQGHFQENSQVMEYHREEDRMRNESDENTEEYPEETPEPEAKEPECEESETPEQIEERNRLIQERFVKYQEQMAQILKEQEQIAEKMKKEAINHIRLSRENCSQVYLKITSDSENPVEIDSEIKTQGVFIDSLIFEEHFVSYCKKSKREPII
jgi:hypothetical protein